MLLFPFPLEADSQENIELVSTKELQVQFERLIELNSHTKNLINFNNREYIAIENHATATQIVQLTKPYLNSKTLNAKNVCLHLLSLALAKRVLLQNQKQQIVELICKNYLDKESIEFADNILLQLHQGDFNSKAKNYIAQLSDKNSDRPISEAAKILAVAQVKESIPYLWSIVKRTVATMESTDLDIMISLARMGEKKAGALLCEYYITEKRITENDRHVFIARRLAFSLDETLLRCLISDYKTIDIKKFYRDVDSGYYPAQTLGSAITAMLKNYPYPDDEFNTDPTQLLDWLNATDNYQLKEK